MRLHIADEQKEAERKKESREPKQQKKRRIVRSFDFGYQNILLSLYNTFQDSGPQANPVWFQFRTRLIFEIEIKF